MEYTFEVMTQSKEIAEKIRALGEVDEVVVTETTPDTKEPTAKQKSQS
jgi:hypothetical protein